MLHKRLNSCKIEKQQSVRTHVFHDDLQNPRYLHKSQHLEFYSTISSTSKLKQCHSWKLLIGNLKHIKSLGTIGIKTFHKYILQKLQILQIITRLTNSYDFLKFCKPQIFLYFSIFMKRRAGWQKFILAANVSERCRWEKWFSRYILSLNMYVFAPTKNWNWIFSSLFLENRNRSSRFSVTLLDPEFVLSYSNDMVVVHMEDTMAGDCGKTIVSPPNGTSQIAMT